MPLFWSFHAVGWFTVGNQVESKWSTALPDHCTISLGDCSMTLDSVAPSPRDTTPSLDEALPLGLEVDEERG